MIGNISEEETIIKKFASIFEGRMDVRGSVKGLCTKEKITEFNYLRHISGQESLGIYPLRTDGTCRWGAIDIDHENIDGALIIIEKLYKIGFNQGIYVERSKSKGYHIFLLCSNWVNAQSIRRIMSCAVSAAGLPHSSEIFPKQDSLNGIQYGNYLNLPYFGGGTPEGRRMVLDLKTLQPIQLAQWINEIELFPAESLDLVINNIPKEASKTIHNTNLIYSNLINKPLPTGERRPTLVKLTGYLRFRGVAEDVAIALLTPWAKQNFIEPLNVEEIEKHIQGIYRRYGDRSLGLGQVLEKIPPDIQKQIEEIWQ